MLTGDRIAELQARLQRSRAELEALAGRAAELRRRATGGGQATPESHAEPALAAALDRLAHETPLPTLTMRDEGDDGRLVSDAWEIALINEEGK